MKKSMYVELNTIANAYADNMLGLVCLNFDDNFTGKVYPYAHTTDLFGKLEPILGRLRC